MTGCQLIAAERQRQFDVEGWTAAHDDQHTSGQLSDAAICYTTQARWFHFGEQSCPPYWPVNWDKSWWKPTGDRIRDLTKAGALIAAEIDRLQRQSGKETEPAVNDHSQLLAAAILAVSSHSLMQECWEKNLPVRELFLRQHSLSEAMATLKSSCEQSPLFQKIDPADFHKIQTH